DLVRLPVPDERARLGLEQVVVAAEPEEAPAREPEQTLVPLECGRPGRRAALDADDPLPKPRASVAGVERGLLAHAVAAFGSFLGAIPDEPRHRHADSLLHSRSRPSQIEYLINLSL